MRFIDDLIEEGILKSKNIIRAFQKIDRYDFVLSDDKINAYLDIPLSIGYGQTISQPLTVAFMLELLKPELGDKILDVGSGSGWTTALLAHIVGKKGRVYGLERLKGLVKFSKENIKKYNFIESKIVEIIQKDGSNGLPRKAPFDKILISAVGEEIPQKLLEQLDKNGRLVMPIGNIKDMQKIVLVTKDIKGRLKYKDFPGFMFVPLVKDNE